MANKIKCTCGHSWSTADSSAKDKYVCHICGKANVNMKHGGWLDKYKQAENGIEGTMGGLTDKGFNYNGAWGGPSMAMGGSMPGAVGFTYARTGSIPDNGPYAKKTKASAQNGMEMKFYQEGLDWKPRNISQDGTYVKKPRTDMLTMDEYRTQQAQAIAKKAIANQPQIKSSSKPINIEERNRKNKEYAQQYGRRYNERTGAVEPLVSANTERTMNRAMENIVEPMLAIEGGMGAGKLVSAGAKKIASKSINKTNSKLLYELVNDPSLKNWFEPSELENVKSQVKQGNRWLQDWVKDPATVSRIEKTGFNTNPKVRKNIEDFISNKNIVRGTTPEVTPDFLGNDVSDFGPLGIYNPDLNRAYVNVGHPEFLGSSLSRSIPSTTVHEGTHVIGAGKTAYNKKISNLTNKIFGKNKDDVMFEEIMSSLGGNKSITSPHETHARIMQLRHHYDLKPGQLVDDAIFDKMIEEGASGKSPVSREFFKNITDKKAFKKAINTLPAVGLGIGAASVQQRKQGGVIKDDMGQWAHPGEITEIDSPYITMEGVPYPVLGVSDEGDTKMMYPGEDYKFKGKKVTEYPVSKKWLEKYK